MNTTQEKNRHCIDVCNSLLRGELSAIEVYSQVIHKYPDEPETARLRHIRDEHIWAVGRLRGNIQEMGGEPDTDSGAWGNVAKSVQGAANLFGENSAICSLEKGEKHGRNEYEDALEDEGVMADCKLMIRTELLPKIDQHIHTLEQLGKS